MSKSCLRMCVVCREMIEKKELLRIVKTDQGVFADRTSKAPGRGAYICKKCLESGNVKKGNINRAFKINLSDENYKTLIEGLNNCQTTKSVH